MIYSISWEKMYLIYINKMDIINEIGPNESENKELVNHNRIRKSVQRPSLDCFINKGYTSNKEQRKQQMPKHSRTPFVLFSAKCF